MTKKVALAWWVARLARMEGVTAAEGPSSKVRATQRSVKPSSTRQISSPT
jgi:hypothetical protein